MTLGKESLLKLINTSLDGSVQLGQKGPKYHDGIKHVRQLVDETFEDDVHADELDEFCVGIICSVQPADSRFNHLLSELEMGILAAAYFLYTAFHPFVLSEVESD